MPECMRRARVYICTPVKAAESAAVQIQILRYAEACAAGSGTQRACTLAASTAIRPVVASVAGPYPRNSVLRAICLRMLLISPSARFSSFMAFTLHCKVSEEGPLVNRQPTYQILDTQPVPIRMQCIPCCECIRGL
jgi:hypothetical protein